MAHRPHAAGSAPSVAPPEYHPLCRECAGVSGGLDEPSPRPPETVLRVSERLHRYAGADMEWCCLCGYRTDAGYYLAPLQPTQVGRVTRYVQEFECVAMKTPEEEMAREAKRRATRDQKGADDRAWMEDALKKLQAYPVGAQDRPTTAITYPEVTYEEVKARHLRDALDGAKGRKHQDRGWLIDSLEQAYALLKEMQREVEEWKEAESALDDYLPLDGPGSSPNYAGCTHCMDTTHTTLDHDRIAALPGADQDAEWRKVARR